MRILLTTSTQGCQGLRDRDPPQPGAKCTFTAIATDTAQHFEEGLLEDLLGLFA